ncbi:hypothetical protein SAMN06296386_11610 [Lachnospiraceae bacterium]|nr:hypothetical protein SAMN06296386_11610 [Lachnospiraceae bacterium]
MMDDTNMIVNDKICELTSSDEYINAPIDERIRLVNALFDALQKEAHIIEYSYNAGEMLYSFTYKSGLSGGVFIKDFSTPSGRIPMN